MPLAELRRLTSVGVSHVQKTVRQSVEVQQDFTCDDPLATWWRQLTPGTTYWRCLVPARRLPGQVLGLTYADLKIGPEGEVYLPRQRGAGIWQFVGNANRALLMAHMQEQGERALMELDDNYLVPAPTVPGLGGSWSQSLDRSSADRYSHQAHRKIIRWVDGIILSTDELAERYARHTKRPLYVCPNSIDLDDWPDLSETAGTVGTSDTGRVIGYAGSGSHRYDLAIVERALDWASRQEGVRIVKLGTQTAGWRFPHEQLPWTDDLAEYRRNLRVLDVGLCPLKRSDWHDCKSDIKALEYLLTGAVPIVQGDSPCYRDWWDIVPSAVTEKDWLRQVKWAVSASPEELREVWDRGIEFLLGRKLIEQHVDKWKAAIEA